MGAIVCRCGWEEGSPAIAGMVEDRNLTSDNRKYVARSQGMRVFAVGRACGSGRSCVGRGAHALRNSMSACTGVPCTVVTLKTPDSRKR